MMGDLRKRLLREEAGFTLSEMLVTTIIMIVVLSALFSIFDMGLRVFSVGNDKVEAVENARLGLEKMEREIRQAYPYDKTDDDPNNDYVFPPGTFLSNSITFGNDLNGDYIVDPDPSTEEITYSLSDECPATLLRNGGPVVEFVQHIPEDPDAPPCPEDVEPLTFEYLDEDGITTADEGAIRMVRIKLEVAVDRGIQERPLTQVLTTEVALRNRGG